MYVCMYIYIYMMCTYVRTERGLRTYITWFNMNIKQQQTSVNNNACKLPRR